MAEFILSNQAVTDVDTVHAQIFADNPVAADRVEEAIFDGFELLARNPALGRKRTFRRHQNIRSWVVTKFTNYLIDRNTQPKKQLLGSACISARAAGSDWASRIGG